MNEAMNVGLRDVIFEKWFLLLFLFSFQFFMFCAANQAFDTMFPIVLTPYSLHTIFFYLFPVRAGTYRASGGKPGRLQPSAISFKNGCTVLGSQAWSRKN